MSPGNDGERKTQYKRRGSLVFTETLDQQLELLRDLKLDGVFFQEITNHPSIKSVDESESVISLGKPLPSKKVWGLKARTTDNPMPTLLWANDLKVMNGDSGAGGVAVPLSATSTLAKSVTIKTAPSNLGDIWVSPDPATTAAVGTGFPMAPGDIQILPVKDLAFVTFFTVLANEQIAALYIPDVDIATKP